LNPPADEKPIRIEFVISGLRTGGAELTLYRLIKSLHSKQFDMSVVSLTTVGTVGSYLEKLGVPVLALRMHPWRINAFATWKLIAHMRQRRPQLVQTWMYHADLFGGLVAKVFAGAPVIWGVRQSNFDPISSNPVTMRIARLCAQLSRRIPSTIVCCSAAAYHRHGELGYLERNMTIIDNGVDVSQFAAAPDAGHKLRAELGVPPQAALVGLVARFDPQKDHATFVKAAVELVRCGTDVHFVFCGEDIEWSNDDLVELVRSAGIAHRSHLLGLRDDIPKVVAGLDILTSSSAYGEGFPNVVAEAMACEVCVVATDVGDSAKIVGEFGWICPIRDHQALVTAWEEILSLDKEARCRIGADARRRVIEHYSLAHMASRYEALYRSLIL